MLFCKNRSHWLNYLPTRSVTPKAIDGYNTKMELETQTSRLIDWIFFVVWLLQFMWIWWVQKDAFWRDKSLTFFSCIIHVSIYVSFETMYNLIIFYIYSLSQSVCCMSEWLMHLWCCTCDVDHDDSACAIFIGFNVTHCTSSCFGSIGNMCLINEAQILINKTLWLVLVKFWHISCSS